MANKSKLLVLGQIFNPISDKKCENYKNGAMLLKKNTKGAYIIERIGPASKLIKESGDTVQILDYSEHVIIPSFFDMHFHWVQDDVREMPKANLLTWLEKYTFPAEHKFKSKKYAKEKAHFFFKRLTAAGTLGGAVYSSIHEHALDYAMEYALGDFIIGNVLMTENSPKFLTQKPVDAQDLAGNLAKKYKKRYAVTPRFAIATDPDTMKESAKHAKKNGSFFQTHLSETENEIEFVKSLYKVKKGFEKVKSYTEIYHKSGMLHERSIMGHGIHLDKDELELLSKTKTSIAHCPTSNAPIKEKGLGSGLFDFKKIEKHGIRWALASDIGGGPILSMLDVMSSFVAQNEKKGVKGATFKKALYRATLAGAEILQLDKKKGNLSEGKEANFIVLPKNKYGLNLEDYFHLLSKRGKRKRSLFDTMPEKVFYQGNLVHSK